MPSAGHHHHHPGHPYPPPPPQGQAPAPAPAAPGEPPVGYYLFPGGSGAAPPSPSPADLDALQAARARRRKWKLVAGALLAAVMLYLLTRSLASATERKRAAGATARGRGPLERVLGVFGLAPPPREEAQAGSGAAGPSPTAGAAGPGAGLAAGADGLPPPRESPAELARLALRLKEAGFVLQGVSHCRWTQVQRELFGAREDEARRVLESIYVECRGEDMCPGLRGYPTWVRGDRKFGGFQPAARLRAILAEVEQGEPRPMLAGPAEPQAENLPDARHAEAAPRLYTRAEAEAMARELAREFGEVPAGESGAKQEEAKEQEGEGAKQQKRTEHARGVAAFAPLNAPNLPGVGPMQLDVEHHEFQALQGNAPRAALADSGANRHMVEQLVRSFDHAQENAARDPRAAVSQAAPLPHSAPLSTGDPLADPALPAPINTPGLQPVVQPEGPGASMRGGPFLPPPNPFQAPA
jgi:hypothetical protein